MSRIKATIRLKRQSVSRTTRTATTTQLGGQALSKGFDQSMGGAIFDVVLVAIINMKSRSEISQFQPTRAGWCGKKHSRLGLNLGLSVFEEVAKGVHFLVGNADDINGAATKQIEHHVLTFRETMVSLTDICPVLPQ